jgi:hypothetical protein
MTIEFAPADADLVGAPEGQQLSADAAGPLVRNEGQFASAAFAAASASFAGARQLFSGAAFGRFRAILPERAITVARTHDLVRNDPTAARRSIAWSTCWSAPAIRMAARPDPDALGFDRKDKAQRDVVRQLARQLDREFRLFLKDPQQALRRAAQADRAGPVSAGGADVFDLERNLRRHDVAAGARRPLRHLRADGRSGAAVESDNAPDFGNARRHRVFRYRRAVGLSRAPGASGRLVPAAKDHDVGADSAQPRGAGRSSFTASRPSARGNRARSRRLPAWCRCCA